MRGVGKWVLGLIAVVCAAVPAEAGKRVALVIGNSAYVNATPLANPSNDAADIAGKLRDMGFDVTLGVDLDKRAFDTKLREFSSVLESADAALLFYAGHGLQIAGRNYLVPIDAKLERERDVEFEAVSLDFVLKQMELDRDTKTNIVFLDACRNNRLSRNLARSMGTRSASIGNGLAETFAGVGTFVSYSTQPGNVALDGEGRNSPFAAALLSHMREPGKSLTSVMIDVRKDVVAATSGKQVPWDHSALTGEFFFDPKAKPAQDSSELQGRVRQLEDEVKLKTLSANTASYAALTELRQRVAQMSEETRRDWERVFEIQRKTSNASDGSERGAMYREIGQLQIGVVRRERDQQELKAQIARLEESLGVKSKEASTARDITPSETQAAAKPGGSVPAISETKKAPVAPPQATASIPKKDEDADVKPVAPAAPAKKANKTTVHKKPKPSIDPDWNTKLFSP